MGNSAATVPSDDLRMNVVKYFPGSSFSFGAHRYQRVSLQLYGFFGHGKTSVVNLCMSVLHNKPYEDIAGAGWSDGTVIRERSEHYLTKYVYITDNRGFVNLDKDEVMEACVQLLSLRHVGEGVKWDRTIEEKLDLLLSKYNTPSTDFIVPIIIYRGTVNMATDCSAKMNKFISRAYEITGIFPIVVLMESGEDLEKIRNRFQLHGVSHIVPLLKFSTEKPERDPETDNEIINFLTLCINEADRGIKKRQGLVSKEEYRRKVMEQMGMELELEREKVREQTKKRDEQGKRDKWAL